MKGRKKSKIRGVNNWSVFVICFIVVGIPFLKEIQITALSPWSRIKHLLKGLFCKNVVLCNKWYFLVSYISICLAYNNFSLFIVWNQIINNISLGWCSYNIWYEQWFAFDSMKVKSTLSTQNYPFHFSCKSLLNEWTHIFTTTWYSLVCHTSRKSTNG